MSLYQLSVQLGPHIKIAAKAAVDRLDSDDILRTDTLGGAAADYLWPSIGSDRAGRATQMSLSVPKDNGDRKKYTDVPFSVRHPVLPGLAGGAAGALIGGLALPTYVNRNNIDTNFADGALAAAGGLGGAVLGGLLTKAWQRSQMKKIVKDFDEAPEHVSPLPPDPSQRLKLFRGSHMGGQLAAYDAIRRGEPDDAVPRNVGNSAYDVLGGLTGTSLLLQPLKGWHYADKIRSLSRANRREA